MPEPDEPPAVDLDHVVEELRRAGARFAYLHGSRVAGEPRPDSDVDIVAWFGRDGVVAWEVAAALPGRVDLLVLDGAPLELAGRVALHARLLFDDDPPARVEWEATTRKIYLDELPRITRSRAVMTSETILADPARLGHVKYLFVTAVEGCIDAAQPLPSSAISRPSSPPWRG